MSKRSGTTRMGIDVGGTFIDYAAVDVVSGTIRFEKQPATEQTLHEEVMTGISRLGVTSGEVSQVFHGTTVAINALVQEKGADVALITTAGFRDVLEIGRGGRPEIYNLRHAPVSPLVARSLRLEVSERMDVSGQVLEPLDSSSVDAALDSIRNCGANSVAICLLHAYANPEHEIAVAAEIHRVLPHVRTTMSHQVVSEWHEFERTSTSVVNSYVQPRFAGYLENLQAELRSDGYTGSIGIMQSNGGVISAERAVALPVKTLMSGPAGGVVASRELARSLGISHAVCADVGGTTFDVSLIVDDQIVEKQETEINRRPVLGSTIDITSVGAGGGSIAHLDEHGSLKVGPESAGAAPGPVCFGKGGERPTVTDAQAILGRLDAGRFLGGRMELDVAAARSAIDRDIAGPLGLSPEQAALGILRIAETNMTNAIRAITVGHGLDPRDFALISYGGGGGLFATLLAEELGVNTVVIPAAAAYFSAWGILSSDHREDREKTKLLILDEAASELIHEFHVLADELKQAMSVYSTSETIRVDYAVDVRFIGQHHTITVPVDGDSMEDEHRLNAAISSEFRRLHDRMYGPRSEDGRLETVTLRAHGTVGVYKPVLESLEPGRGEPPTSVRETWLRPVPCVAKVYRRESLGSGFELRGPAVIEESTNTIIVPDGWVGRVETTGHLTLTNDSEGAME